MYDIIIKNNSNDNDSYYYDFTILTPTKSSEDIFLFAISKC